MMTTFKELEEHAIKLTGYFDSMDYSLLDRIRLLRECLEFHQFELTKTILKKEVISNG